MKTASMHRQCKLRYAGARRKNERKQSKQFKKTKNINKENESR
jgi:hypothetical protein